MYVDPFWNENPLKLCYVCRFFSAQMSSQSIYLDLDLDPRLGFRTMNGIVAWLK